MDEMSNRLDTEKQSRLEPKRIETVKKTLLQMGFDIEVTRCGKGLSCKRENIKFIIFPYSGWWSGKGIGQGRGFVKLIEKL